MPERTRTASLHGRQIKPMAVSTLGRNDRVYHTLKHFLNREWCSDWLRVPPRDAADPRVLDADSPAGLDPATFDQNKPDRRWWTAPGLSYINTAYFDGYHPRILTITDAAGDWATPGSRWVKTKFRDRGRWVNRATATVRGFRVVGDFGKGSFRLVTCYRNRVLRTDDVTSGWKGLGGDR